MKNWVRSKWATCFLGPQNLLTVSQQIMASQEESNSLPDKMRCHQCSTSQCSIDGRCLFHKISQLSQRYFGEKSVKVRGHPWPIESRRLDKPSHGALRKPYRSMKQVLKLKRLDWWVFLITSCFQGTLPWGPAWRRFVPLFRGRAGWCTLKINWVIIWSLSIIVNPSPHRPCIKVNFLGLCTQAAGDAAEELFFLPSGIEILHTDLGCFHNELPGGQETRKQPWVHQQRLPD